MLIFITVLLMKSSTTLSREGFLVMHDSGNLTNIKSSKLGYAREED